MWDQFQIAHRGWSRAFLVLLLCASFRPGVPPSAQAHSILSEFIQHGVQLTVGTQHIDVTLDLTFFEEWSVRERKVLDADGSGDVIRSEIESYLKRLAPQLARQVKLRVAGRELALVPLYEPEIDLLGDNQVGPAHHRLRLFFFAPTPELRAGDDLLIESRLWPEAKALATPQSEGRDGCKLTTLISVDAGLTDPRSKGEERLFTFRCLVPPTKASQAASSSSRSSLSAPKPSFSPGPLKTSATPSEP